ncbi:MAG: hypothetical protein IPM37_13270 [Hahellaceae bacterium]|nr:hypothetical protein [Hahellaceae bacterium]
MSQLTCPHCQYSALHFVAAPLNTLSTSDSDYITESCPRCGMAVQQNVRTTALGQFITGIAGMLISSFLMIQQLSAVIGLWQLGLYSELPMAVTLLLAAALFLGACFYLIQISFHQAVGMSPSPLQKQTNKAQ